MTEIQIEGRSKSRYSNWNKSKFRFGQQVQCWNYGKAGHFKGHCKSPKKNDDDSTNIVDSPFNDWVLDLGASFHTTPHQEIIQKYVKCDFDKVYLADGEALDVVRMEDV